eukprot:359193-Chlamydomonas_euryale.AAC.8
MPVTCVLSPPTMVIYMCAQPRQPAGALQVLRASRASVQVLRASHASLQVPCRCCGPAVPFKKPAGRSKSNEGVRTNIYMPTCRMVALRRLASVWGVVGGRCGPATPHTLTAPVDR